MRRLLKRLATLAVGLLALGGSRAAVAQPKPVPGSNATGGGIGTTGPAPTGPGGPLYNVQLSGPLDAAGLTAGTDDGDDARHWYAADRATIA